MSIWAISRPLENIKIIRCKLPIKWIIMLQAAGYYYPNNQSRMSIASNAERNRGGRSNLKQEKNMRLLRDKTPRRRNRSKTGFPLALGQKYAATDIVGDPAPVVIPENSPSATCGDRRNRESNILSCPRTVIGHPYVFLDSQ
jgi:hypothetical protein